MRVLLAEWVMDRVCGQGYGGWARSVRDDQDTTRRPRIEGWIVAHERVGAGPRGAVNVAARAAADAHVEGAVGRGHGVALTVARSSPSRWRRVGTTTVPNANAGDLERRRPGTAVGAPGRWPRARGRGRRGSTSRAPEGEQARRGAHRRGTGDVAWSWRAGTAPGGERFVSVGANRSGRSGVPRGMTTTIDPAAPTRTPSARTMHPRRPRRRPGGRRPRRLRTGARAHRQAASPRHCSSRRSSP